MFDLQQYLRNKNALSPDLATGGDGPDLEDDSDEDDSGKLDPPKPYVNNEDGYNQPSSSPKNQLDAPPTPDAPSPGIKGAPAYNLSNTYKQLQSLPVGAAQQKYKDFLDNNLPDKDDYSPSKTQRVAAILSGIAAGAQGKDGFSAARGVLDEPYQEAMYNYKLQGDKLGKSADLEEKDINNRVKTFRDIEEAGSKADTNARLGKLNDAQIKNIQSEIDKRAADLKTNGYVKNLDKTTGHMMMSKVNPDSPTGYDTIDLGKYDLTPGEQITNAGKKAGAIANAELPAKQVLAKTKSDQTDNRIKLRFDNAKQLLQLKNDNPNYTLRENSDGNIEAFNPKDPSDHYDTGVKSAKLTDAERITLGMKAKDTEVTTEVDGKEKVVTTKHGDPASAKIKMKDPTGKPFLVDPKEVDEAIKHGWTK